MFYFFANDGRQLSKNKFSEPEL